MKKALALLVVAIVVCQVFAVLSPSARAQAPSDSAPEVVCVPFHGTLLGVPHDAWLGKEIVLKGTAHDPDGDSTLEAYKWDFGDGYSTDWIAGVNPYIIEARHTYTGTMADGTPYGVGKHFTAWLHVRDADGLVGQDSYFIAVKDKTLDVEVNVAIDDGLWWLHKQAYRYTSDGIDYARWSSVSSYYTSATAESVLAFEIKGHQPIGNPDENPYVETVQRGLNYVFSRTRVVDISAWGPGTSSPYGDPDTNGNDIGIGISSSQEVYELGMVMMAIAASGDPGLTADTGPTGVVGRIYKDILTDMVDICAWGQNDYGGARGGWRYAWNYGSSDNSVSQWPMMALEAAETNWGIMVADFVKPELDTYWLTYSQRADGGFGYSGPSTSNIARTGTGIIGLNYVGLLADNPRIVNAVNWLGNHWSEFGNYYGMYAVMKAMRTANPEITMVGTHDWYAEYAQYLVNTQQADDGWPNYYGRVLATDWAILIMTPTVTKPGPVADAGPDVDNFPPTIPLEFDASGSHHMDPTRSIVLYEWDFDSDGTWDYSGTDLEVEHAYPAYYKSDGSIDWDATAKDYTATLRVTDNSDPPLQDTDTCVVHITAPPWKPVADPDGPYEGYEGVPIQLDGSKSYDPESRMYAETHPWYETIAKFEWDLDNDGQFDDSTETQPSYTWATKGTYSVGLKVTDSQPSGPSGAIGPLDVDTKYATVVIDEPGFNVAVVFTKFSNDDPAPSRPLTEFQSIKEDLDSYYHEVSYGSISFDTRFYPDDGSWLRLPENRKYYGKNEEQYVKDAIDVSDGIVDFTKYDYDTKNGLGIVILIHAGHSKQEGKSNDDMSTQVKYGGVFSTSGGYDTKDDTKIDAIIAPETDNVGGWAHEVGHVLGKLLVTSITGTSKDGAWYLPDRYKGGYLAGQGDIGDWGLMASGSWLPRDWLGGGTGTHPDHMCSFSKEWLGWLKYHQYQHPSYGSHWIDSLVTMAYGNEVFQYKINDNMYYILEVRNKNSRYTIWDTTAPTPWLHDSAEVIYKVEKKSDTWIVNVQSSIVLSPVPIVQSNYYSDDANKVMFEVVDEKWETKYEMKTEVKEPTIWNKIGAVLNPGARLLSVISKVITPQMPFQLEYPLPDLDLHAYSVDGKHVGINYVTGEYELQIPEATTSGDLWNGQEWIFVPDDVKVQFRITSRDNAEFLNAFPEAMSFTDGVDAYALSLIYYDSNEISYDSAPVTREINPGDEITHRYAIIPNPDGTHTPVIDDTPPVLTVEVPQENVALQDGVTLTASAWDENGVSSVTFSIREPNGEQGTIISPDFEYMPASPSTGDMWELPFDTTLLPDGYYLAYVEATDIAGNVASDVVPFSIRNWAVIELLPSTEDNKAGRTMPVKFALRVAAEVDPNQPFVYNEELRIEIFATADPDNVLQESYYGDTARDYRISSRHYITNFKTIKRKPMEYTVAIYRDTFDVGSFTFETVK